MVSSLVPSFSVYITNHSVYFDNGANGGDMVKKSCISPRRVVGIFRRLFFLGIYAYLKIGN